LQYVVFIGRDFHYKAIFASCFPSFKDFIEDMYVDETLCILLKSQNTEAAHSKRQITK